MSVATGEPRRGDEAVDDPCFVSVSFVLLFDEKGNNACSIATGVSSEGGSSKLKATGAIGGEIGVFEG